MLKNTFNKFFSKKKKKKDSKQQKQFQCYQKDVPISSSVESDDQLDNELRSAKKFIQNYRKKLLSSAYKDDLKTQNRRQSSTQATLNSLQNNLKEYRMYIKGFQSTKQSERMNDHCVDRKNSKPFINKLLVNLKSLTNKKQTNKDDQKELRTYLHSSEHSKANRQLIREVDEINFKRKLNQRFELENYFKQNFCNCKNQRNLQTNDEGDQPPSQINKSQDLRSDLTMLSPDNFPKDNYYFPDLSASQSSLSKYEFDELNHEPDWDNLTSDHSKCEFNMELNEIEQFNKNSGDNQSVDKQARRFIESNPFRQRSNSNLDLSYISSSQPYAYSLASDPAEEDDDQYLDTYTIGSANTDDNPISTEHYTKLIRKLTESDEMRYRLLELCNQQDALDFDQEFSKDNYPYVLNLDSGTFAITFLAFDRNKNLVVLKVIRTISKDIQTKLNQLTYSGTETFDEVYSEVMISKALSSLHDTEVNNAHCFPKILFTKVVHGQIPDNFIITRLKDSKPDQIQALTPEQFYDALNRNQQLGRTDSCILNDKKKFLKQEPFKLFPDAPIEYTVIAMKYVGKPIWKRLLNRQLTAQQLFSVAQQLIFGLACAEQQFKFEHRDLHISNILVKRTRKPEIKFVINNHIYRLATFGYRCFVVDMTFSRLSVNNQVFYKDLSAVLYKRYEPDKIKKLKMQDMVYQLMRDEIGDNWQRFRPRTNIHWLTYVLKTIKGCELYKKSTGPMSQLLVDYINQTENCNNLSDLIEHIVASSDAGETC